MNKCFSHSNNLARSSLLTFLSSKATFLSSATTLLSSAANLLSSATASWFLAIFLTSFASTLAFTIASIAFLSSSSPFFFFFSVLSFLHPSDLFGFEYETELGVGLLLPSSLDASSFSSSSSFSIASFRLLLKFKSSKPTRFFHFSSSFNTS